MSEFVTVRFRTSAMRQRMFILRTEFDAIAATIPERGAEMAVTKAKATTAWSDRSHKTRDSIRARQIGPYRWRFVARGAALWLNEGTGIFGPNGSPIVPLRAQFLRFTVGGKLMFRRSVKGQRATHFVDHAREDAEIFMLTDVVHQLNGVINAHNR